MLVEKFHEPFLVGPEPEEIIGLHDLAHLSEDLRPGAVGTAVLFLQKLLLARAVETVVLPEVDLPLVVQLLEHGAHHPLVPLLGRADEIVVGDEEFRQERAKLRAHLVGELQRRDPALAGALLHLLAVLVGPGEKIHLLPLQAVKPGDDVRQHFLVGVPEVRRTVHIIDRGGEVE